MKFKTLLLFIACVNFFNAQNNGLPTSDYYYIYDDGGGVHLGIDLTKSEQVDSVYAIEIFDEDRKKIYSDTLTFVSNKITLREVDGTLLFTIRYDRNAPDALKVYNLENKELYTARYASTTEKEEREQKDKKLYLSEVRSNMKSYERLYSFDSIFVGVKKMEEEEILVSVLSENGASENIICKKSRTSGDSVVYSFQDELNELPLEFSINDKIITTNFYNGAVFERVSIEVLSK
jgi:hypothetical protein